MLILNFLLKRGKNSLLGQSGEDKVTIGCYKPSLQLTGTLSLDILCTNYYLNTRTVFLT